MIKRFLNSQTKSISGAAIVLAISTIISGFLGLIRDRLLASTFGAGIETSIYFAAFRIPDLIYNILILGGVLVAFLPLFSEYFTENKDKAWEMTNHVLNAFLLLLILTCALLCVFTPWLIKFITPGFAQKDKEVVVSLTRILFLSPILFGAANIFSGVLHYFNRFFAYSLAPLLYNIGIIFGILFLSPKFGIFGVGLGVILGAALYLIIQIPSAINCGFRYKFFLNFKHPAIKKIFSLMIPRTFGVMASQINIIIITAIASTITAGSIAIFSFSNNLQGLPVSILGISLATAIFPAFSKLWANGQKKELVEKFSGIFRQTLFLIVPASILIFFLRAQIVRLVLGAGRFDWEDTKLTAASLGLFSFSIFASTLIPFIARAFFSFKDTKTPAIVTLISVSINATLGFLFVWLLGFPNSFSNFLESLLKVQGMRNVATIGLPLAFSIAAISQFVFLLFFLYRKVGDFGVSDILKSVRKTLVAGVFMAIFTYLSLQLASLFVDTQTFFGLFLQASAAGFTGTAVYFAISFFLKSPELKTIKYSFLRQIAGIY